jgi:alkanesulfonate monooxygenase SsuD/methylene tetrahydromethanopterin reductase-like flavin-dependent oxidoreductase (luciferase family)
MDGWVTLTALLQATTRLRGGVLVSGMVYRHPALLANMATTLDITSGGRLELGIGAGWNEEECDAFGIDLGSMTEARSALCQLRRSTRITGTTRAASPPNLRRAGRFCSGRATPLVGTSPRSPAARCCALTVTAPRYDATPRRSRGSVRIWVSSRCRRPSLLLS